MVINGFCSSLAAISLTLFNLSIPRPPHLCMFSNSYLFFLLFLFLNPSFLVAFEFQVLVFLFLRRHTWFCCKKIFYLICSTPNQWYVCFYFKRILPCFPAYYFLLSCGVWNSIHQSSLHLTNHISGMWPWPIGIAEMFMNLVFASIHRYIHQITVMCRNLMFQCDLCTFIRGP